MRLYKCLGISMLDLVRSGDIVIFDESLPIRVFDLVVFNKNDIYFCHRCILTTKNHIIEFGENAKHPSIIKKENVIGRCVGLIRDNNQYKFAPFSLKYYLYLWKIIFFKFLWFKIIGVNEKTTKEYIKRLNTIKQKIGSLQKKGLLPIQQT